MHANIFTAVILAIYACQCISCQGTTKPKITSFSVRVEDYGSASGALIIHQVTDRKYLIASQKREGDDNVVESEQFLDSRERQKWVNILSSFDFQMLDEVYENPHVWDGQQLFFEFEINGFVVRRTQVSNFFHPQLAVVTSALDELAPQHLRLHYEQSSDP